MPRKKLVIKYASLRRFVDDLKLMSVSDRTREAYLCCVRQLSDYYRKDPRRVTVEELRQYFIYLKFERKLAWQTSTQAICAIKMFWKKTLRRHWPEEVRLVRADREEKLPVILSVREVHRILNLVREPHHQACLKLIYACGLRLSEALKLEVRDIDAENNRIHIRLAKGGRDCYVPLPAPALPMLHSHWKSHRNKRFIFPAPGRNGKGMPKAARHIDDSSVQRALKLALKASGIGKHACIDFRPGKTVVTNAIPASLRGLRRERYPWRERSRYSRQALSWLPQNRYFTDNFIIVGRSSIWNERTKAYDDNPDYVITRDGRDLLYGNYRFRK